MIVSHQLRRRHDGFYEVGVWAKQINHCWKWETLTARRLDVAKKQYAGAVKRLLMIFRDELLLQINTLELRQQELDKEISEVMP